jgi:DNA-binding winged helix-turn-helix (wHTH) protein
MTLAFDEFVLDLAKRELRRGQTPVQLEPQAFDLLSHLIAHRHRVVGREELTEAVWRGRIVSDAALTTRISAIRRALGDTGRMRRLIQTVSRKGFRFVAAVQEFVDANADGQEIGEGSAAATARSRRQPEPASIGVFPFAALTEGVVEQSSARAWHRNL